MALALLRARSHPVVRHPARTRERILAALGECTIAELAAETQAPPGKVRTAVLHTHI